MTTKAKVLAVPLTAAAVLLGGAAAGYASLAGAQTTTPSAQQRPAGPMGPHVHGAITAINGSNVTISDDGTSYTIDASNAKVMKFVEGSAPTTVSLQALAIGDEIGVRGTVSGTSVTATEIMTGTPPFKGGKGMMGRGRGVMGTVESVNGSTLTVKSPNGETFTIDASGANVTKTVTGSLSDVSVGERIGVEGSVSGTSVTATHIMADIPEPPARQ